MIILVQHTKHGDKEHIQQRWEKEGFHWHLLFILHRATGSLCAAPTEEIHRICADWAKGSWCSDNWISIISDVCINRDEGLLPLSLLWQSSSHWGAAVFWCLPFSLTLPWHTNANTNEMASSTRRWLLVFNFFQHFKHKDTKTPETF